MCFHPKISQKLVSNPTKYSGHSFPHKRLPQNVWPSKKSPRKSFQTQQSIQGITFQTKDRHKKCDHSSRANLSPHTSIRTSYKCYKTSFKMGLDYVLKEPSYYPLEVKRRCGVTQKKPFRRFEIVCLVFRIFLRIFFSYQNKSIKSFIVTGRFTAL